MSVADRVPHDALDSHGSLRVVAVAAALLVVIVLHRAEWASMVSTWMENETFAHGALIAPIAAWLGWRERHRLAGAARSTGGIAPLLAVAALGVVWIVGEAAQVNAPRQFAAVGIAVAVLAAGLGREATRTLAFPLAFLFFMVPFGDFLLPTMMEWTAAFTVGAVRASGVPVYREGLEFVLPNGRWSVVEACSGLRYLIASVVLGTLYAHLWLRTTPMRLAFTGLCVVVPILANWLRAYGIVMTGHLSGMTLAVGIDHLLYGWVFFGVVMFILFRIGMSMSRRERSRPGAPAASAALPADRRASRPAIDPRGGRAVGRLVPTILATACVLAAVPHAIDAAMRRSIAPLDAPQLLAAVGAGLRPDERPLGFRPHFHGAHASVSGRVDGDAPVGVAVDYFARQRHGREMIVHGNGVIAPEARQWRILRSAPVRIEARGGPFTAREYVLAGPDDAVVRVIHWYAVDGRHTADEGVAKLATAASMLRGHGDHSFSIAVWSASARVKQPGPPGDAPEIRLREVAGGLADAVDALAE